MKIKKRIIIAVSAILIFLFSAMSFSACGEEKKPGYVSRSVTVNEDGTFKILQLTDIHLINSTRTNKELERNYSLRDGWAEEAVTCIVEEADPDLIIVTGDSIFTLDIVKAYTKTNDTLAAFKKFAKFMDSFEIPWLFLFGNHDEEGLLRHEDQAGSAEGAKKVLSDYLMSDELHYCWYDAGPENLNGIGNYIVNVLNRDGTVNQSLVMMDSGSYIRVYDEESGKMMGNQRQYECIHDDQLDWYEAAIRSISEKQNGGELVSSLFFLHIPFPEYQYVLEAYLDKLEELGEDWKDTIKWDGVERTLMTDIGEITYHGGMYGEPPKEENQRVDTVLYKGHMYGDSSVCCSFVGTWRNKTYDGGHTFERIRALGSSKYVFCGHDHRNTFMFTYEGIRINYGMSIDYSANGISGDLTDLPQTIYDETEQRGGTLITLKPNSEVEIEQIHFLRNLYREALDAAQGK